MNAKPAADLHKVFAGTMKFVGLGSGAMLAYFLLQMFTPEAIAEVLKSWGPGFGTGALLGGLVIWRVDKRFGEGIAAVNGMTKAQEGLTVSIGSIASSLHHVAESHGTELEAIKASVGSLHGKMDDVLERLPQP